MRKIEQNMINAVYEVLAQERTHWHQGNTTVTEHPKCQGGAIILLHGNAIAKLYPLNDGSYQVLISLAGWNTHTTRSRLNVIIKELGTGAYSGVIQDNFMPKLRIIDGVLQPMTHKGWYEV